MIKNKKNKEVTSNIRCPEYLWNELKQLADEDTRSLNEEIIHLIKKEIDSRKSTKTK